MPEAKQPELFLLLCSTAAEKSKQCAKLVFGKSWLNPRGMVGWAEILRSWWGEITTAQRWLRQGVTVRSCGLEHRFVYLDFFRRHNHDLPVLPHRHRIAQPFVPPQCALYGLLKKHFDLFAVYAKQPFG